MSDRQQGLGSALRETYAPAASDGLDPGITRLMLILSQDPAAGRSDGDRPARTAAAPPPRAGLFRRIRAILR